ncbi:metallophosphoesterase [Hahella sp. HN01]|uniref:metallophosphoesterase n=1 Tax=Hahella sp. HN01 TaxID=2847262 RepID=UPI001C1ED3D2|nr:metallophosphoesterase [Hahella sp. HN01]MBU6951501.1 metallophosphoesterase family protein [Hahella sp. HN01]
MKIRVLSDLHLEFEDFAVDIDDVDALVLAGDIHVGDKGVRWALEQNPAKPIIYVLGNHEYYRHIYPKLARKLREMTQGTHVHVLENESVALGDVVFFGCTLWTDFELLCDPRVAGFECQQVMSDFRKIRREPGYSKVRSLDLAVIHSRSLHWLKGAFAHCDETHPTSRRVVVTHHAPSSQSLPLRRKNDIISSAYASNLEPVIESLQPNLWIHGHLHNSSDYQIGTTRVVCNPRGYPGERNLDFDPAFTVSLS